MNIYPRQTDVWKRQRRKKKKQQQKKKYFIDLTRGNWPPTSSKGVSSACFCELYKVKDRTCLMIPFGQLRPGTKGRSGGLNACLLITHFATVNYWPVCTKGASFVMNAIFSKGNQLVVVYCDWLVQLGHINITEVFEVKA